MAAPTAKKKFIIIDGNAILHRAWHALPPLTTKKGEMVNAVYGFSSILLKVIKDIKPDYLAVAWDLPGPTFRHLAYPEYKATREKKPEELYRQVWHVKDVLQALNIPSYEKKGFEADDIIGTICDRKQVDNPNVDSIIVTGDLDTLQLVDNNTSVYSIKRGISDLVIYDQAAVKERYGLTPDQLIDFKALKGDPSDNIPGVPGIGEKTAAELLKKFGTLEKIYEALEKNRPAAKEIKEKIREKLLQYKKQVYLSKKLVTIVRDVDVKFDLQKGSFGQFDRDKVVKLFQELEFRSLLAKVPEMFKAVQPKLFEPSRPEAAAKTVTSQSKLANLLKKMKKDKELVIFSVTDGQHPIRASFAGLGFSLAAHQGYFIPLSMLPSMLPALKSLLEDPKILKIGHDLKNDYEILSRFHVNLRPLSFDTLVASYLLNPGSRAHSLEDLAFTEFGLELINLEKLIKDFKAFDKVPGDALAKIAAEGAEAISLLKPKLEAALKKNKLNNLFEKIELPLISVLARMEQKGVKIDSDRFKKMSKKVAEQLAKISGQIYQLSGEEFNINSPQQLKRILFEKLKIPVGRIKKTKTGLSTAAAELEKMRGLHPIIDLISQARELAKLQSTYLDALPDLVNSQTGRVHTSFNQAVTATGRLSSSNPNLQNIPIRTELGREIRKAFVAEKGFKILTADYSQIELRLIAALSGDKNMVGSFKKGEDIHKRTASEIYGVKIEDVTKEMRDAAKTVNFGVIYGQGPSALAQQTGLSFDEAREFISKYFQIYQGVKNFLEAMKESARQKGYVQTLFGRIRYLPEINSGVPVIRAQAERMASNMPVQGTAADLIKMAMIEIDRELYGMEKNETGANARMILQVHDELVFEVKKDWLEQVGRLVKTKMEQVEKLAVPLVAKIQVGESWGEMEEETHLFEE